MRLKNINEECGIFGVFNYKEAFEVTKFALSSLQHRGQEGCGIVHKDGKFFKSHKGIGLVNQVFHNTYDRTSNSAIGHVRYSTTGEGTLENLQPFLINSVIESFGLCHNGNLVNTNELRQQIEETGSIFNSSSDTEVIAHLYRKEKGTRDEKICKALSKLRGSFAFLFMFEDAIYAVRDSKGLRPLCLGKLGNSYVVSSESCAFSVIGAEFVRDIAPGEVVRIDETGLSSKMFSNETSYNLCAMEYIYFARQDSTIDGTNVHEYRFNTGVQLGLNDDVEVDMVIGVPDSGISAALGYAKARDLPFNTGLIKNRYSGRTFIEPTDELRKLGIKLKLSVIEEVVRDKRLIVVDDSIVRGNTSKKLVELLLNSGAKEVHLRIGSAKITSPCFYGVDFSTYDELIGAKMSVEELRDYIGCHSLKYISVDTIKECSRVQLCTACFDGKYPTELYSNSLK